MKNNLSLASTIFLKLIQEIVIYLSNIEVFYELISGTSSQSRRTAQFDINAKYQYNCSIFSKLHYRILL